MKSRLLRILFFVFGILLYAFVFNIFYLPYDMVISGSTGLSLIFNEWIGISPSLFVAIVSYTLIIFSFIYLGKEMTLKTIVGTILYPIFLEITSHFALYFDRNLSSMLLVSIYGGALIGFANGIMIKTGYTTGGFNIIYQILYKYFKIPIGKSIFIVNCIIICFGLYVFGIANALYSVVALFISSIVTDRVLLGISKAKTFYIITSKPKYVEEIIINKLGHTVTEVDARGGYTSEKKKMLMSVIPTKEYFKLKESVKEIDRDAFFLITDTYEVIKVKGV